MIASLRYLILEVLAREGMNAHFNNQHSEISIHQSPLPHFTNSTIVFPIDSPIL